MSTVPHTNSTRQWWRLTPRVSGGKISWHTSGCRPRVTGGDKGSIFPMNTPAVPQRHKPGRTRAFTSSSASPRADKRAPLFRKRRVGSSRSPRSSRRNRASSPAGQASAARARRAARRSARACPFRQFLSGQQTDQQRTQPVDGPALLGRGSPPQLFLRRLGQREMVPEGPQQAMQPAQLS